MASLILRRLKLVAAFDHRNIFIDPNPDPEKSYTERLRLFHLPTSSWEDYNSELISMVVAFSSVGEDQLT